MQFIGDFHIHSKYSRATGKLTDLEHLFIYSKFKGIDVVGTGDFTHPKWFSEIKNKLKLEDNGLFTIKDQSLDYVEDKNLLEINKIFNKNVYFIPTAEIACIFKEKDRGRRLHIVLIANNLESIEKINKELSEIGNLYSDGRPILGLHAKKLLEICLNIDKNILFVPAHIFTPWFGLYGSKSGFDSIYDCFGDLTQYIYALETGLSADPEMIYRVEEAKKFQLISNSDAHSPENLGREANVFEGEKLSTENIINALKNKDNEKLKLKRTIEFFPEEGKYHYDGHANCKVCFSPEETLKHNGLCPVCGRELIKGVLYRVNELANNKEKNENNIKNEQNYYSIAPLKMVIAEVLEKGETSKAVLGIYDTIIKKGYSEFDILVFLNENKLDEILYNIKEKDKIKKAIIDIRNKKVNKIPGYDGVFGRIELIKDKVEKEQEKIF